MVSVKHEDLHSENPHVGAQECLGYASVRRLVTMWETICKQTRAYECQGEMRILPSKETNLGIS